MTFPLSKTAPGTYQKYVLIQKYGKYAYTFPGLKSEGIGLKPPLSTEPHSALSHPEKIDIWL